MHEELRRRGGGVLAVSVDPPATSAKLALEQRLGFPILSDVRRELVGQLGLLHEGGAPDGSDIAVPASFLLDRDRHVVWRHVAARIPDRPDPRELLAKIRSRWPLER